VLRVVALIGLTLYLCGGQAVEAKDGVVLLHGLCRSDTSMDAMGKALAAEGYAYCQERVRQRGSPMALSSHSGPALCPYDE
jgi:hypothetical protein